MTKEQWETIDLELARGISKAQISRSFGVSRHSIWAREQRKKAKLVETKKKGFWSKLFGK